MNSRIVKTGVLFICIGLIGLNSLSAQNRIGKGDAKELFNDLCSGCHGESGAGRMGLNLVDDQWKYGSSDQDLTRAIRDGFPDMNKPGFGQVLSEQEIRALVIYLRELKVIADRDEILNRTMPKDGVFRTAIYNFELETVFETSGIIWSLDFLPDQTILATERGGTLWLVKGGKGKKIEGIPEVWNKGQGGLLEVAVHPDYKKNGWIYLSFSVSSDGRNGITKVVRGKIENFKWHSEETLFAPEASDLNSGVHFGSRFVFKDGYLFFSIGDRGRKQRAQDINRPNGKIFRIHDDGRIPKDNPFVGQGKLADAVWSYGHRNPQGLDKHPANETIWESEHGPRGGDEINLIERGKNYGWPEITHGMNYNGTPITDKTAAPGMEQPKLHWTPSIAVCGIDFYEGNLFPKWINDLFVTGLASEELHRLRIEKGKVTDDEIILKNQGRLRDVANGPDGYLYLSFESREKRTARIVRLMPAGE